MGLASIVARNPFLPLVAFLRLKRHCGDWAGTQASKRDWLAGDLAIAIFAFVYPPQSRIDFGNQFALPVAGAQLDTPIGFA